MRYSCDSGSRDGPCVLNQYQIAATARMTMMTVLLLIGHESGLGTRASGLGARIQIVNPSRNGSSSSATNVCSPVIQAVPSISVEIAGSAPTCVRASTRPRKSDPTSPSCTNGRSCGSSPIASSTLITADMPVPLGERLTMRPVTVIVRKCDSGSCGGPVKMTPDTESSEPCEVSGCGDAP